MFVILATQKASPGKVSETPFSTNKPGIVVCTCDPSYVGDIGRSIWSEACPGQKFKALAQK
jgi:hypothetical protein